MPQTAPILVIGHDGQLAASLRACAKKHALPLIAMGHAALDLTTATEEKISEIFNHLHPWIVINAAAFTQVDKAETEKQKAFHINRDAVALLRDACAQRNLPFIHLSTDYVFNGEKGAPYLETDPVAPLGIYGKSKEAGEQEALKWEKTIILRTSWVYSAYGKNFVKTILQAAATRPLLKVVNDQKGCPTAAPALAEAILSIVEILQKTGWKPEYKGIFHATGQGETTWYGFTEFLLAQRKKYGLSVPELVPVSTQEYPTPAKRPADSRLNGQKLQDVFNISLPAWQESCAPIAFEILQSSTEDSANPGKS